MEDWFDYYVGLYAAGRYCFATLPENLQNWISNYGAGGWLRFPGILAAVVEPGAVAPIAAVAPPEPAFGYAAGGAPAHPSAALPRIPEDGSKAAREAVGGTPHTTASPYIHSVNPLGVAVAYGNAPSMNAFLHVWDLLVQAAAPNGAEFAWPAQFSAPGGRLQFLAAVFAEGSRDYCQLGAIYTALLLRQRNELPSYSFNSVLPMCTGSTYVPQVHRWTPDGLQHCVSASPITWSRAKDLASGITLNVNKNTMSDAISYVRYRTAASGYRRLTTSVKFPRFLPPEKQTALIRILKS